MQHKQHTSTQWAISSLKDETGEEGVLVLPGDGSKKVKMGTRVSADKVKQEECESAAQMHAPHERNMEKVKVCHNTQEWD